MIGDLLDILNAVKDAQSEQEKQEQEDKLQARVEEEINTLFDDPRYPKRQRTFKAIRRRLGIYDHEPEKLNMVLFTMGATRVRGDGEDAYWHLPAAPAPQASPPVDTVTPKPPSGTPPDPPRRKSPWPGLFAALGAIAALVAILGWMGIEFDDIWPPWGPDLIEPELCDKTKLNGEEFQECMDNGGVEYSP